MKEKLFYLFCKGLVVSLLGVLALAGGVLYFIFSPILAPTEDGIRTMKDRYKY